MNLIRKAVPLAAGLVAVSLTGCANYVKRDELNSQLAELRATDSGLRTDVDGLKAQVDSLANQMQTRFSGYDAKIEKLAGRVRIDMTTHFAFDNSQLRDQDKPALDDFASVIRENQPDAVITVEGFTDSAGSQTYNKKLGLARADAVKDYLVNTGGLDPSKIRTVSYGKEQDRQVDPGAWGEKGEVNRRVALVVDYVPPANS